MLVKMQKEDKVTYEKREKNGGRYRKGGKKDDTVDTNIMGKKGQKKSRDDYKNITKGWLEKKEEKGQDYRGGRKTGKEPVTD